MMRADVVVIGAGVMGASTALALARQNTDVILLEQFTVGHTRGSSHGQSRIFRLSYPDAMYVEMAVESLTMWREYERVLGATFITTTGGLDAGDGIEANAIALAECGVDFEIVEARQVQERFPFLAPPPDTRLLFQKEGGIAHADIAVNAFVRGARDQGARVIEETRVDAIEPGASSVTLRIGEESIEAGRVVVTAGAWARGLLAPAGIELPVSPTRETVAYFQMAGPLPPTLVEWGDPAVYCLPSPGEGLKVGEHIAGPLTDPDDAGEPDQKSVDRLSQWVAERWPGAGTRPVKAETCLYTNTADQSFILERHGQVVVGSPCSGHGFKFAPLIGRRLADLAIKA
jgi:sarcosine oxidase